jgi:formylglycine-generating enzyme required for sulfatase activity
VAQALATVVAPRAPARRAEAPPPAAGAAGRSVPPPLPRAPRAAAPPAAAESPFAPLAAPAPPARRRSTTPGQRKRPPWTAWVAGAGGLVALGLLSLVVLTFRTAEGPVVVEIDQKDAQVFVDGRQITIQVPGDMRPIEITVDERKHELLVKKDGFESVTREFSYRKGKAEPIRVTLKPLPKVVSDPAALTNSIGMKLVRIPAGKFQMGSPRDEANRSDNEEQHEVEISRPFYLGVYEVTQAQYEAVMGSNPSHFSATGGGKDKVKGLDTSQFPVERVSWKEAVEFCEKLSALDAKKGNKRVCRLPTEAEWEYACRGGAASADPFHFGTSLSSTQANFNGDHPYGGAPHGPNLERTCEVGSYKPNRFGLYDMHGNVWEWCADWHGEKYYKNSPRKDPTGPTTGTARVLRGGSWDFGGRYCRAAYRGYYVPGDRDVNFGFRVACSAPPGTP